jgi:hypothetical protein
MNVVATVEFNAARRELLRKAYNDAVESEQKVFTFDGNEYLTAYAKYMLEYLDMVIA